MEISGGYGRIYLIKGFVETKSMWNDRKTRREAHVHERVIGYNTKVKGKGRRGIDESTKKRRLRVIIQGFAG